jgi:hypothetical protein
MFELQKEQLAQLIPGNKEVDDWYEALVGLHILSASAHTKVITFVHYKKI